MIHSHLYTRKKETPVFGHPMDDGSPICFLDQGKWLGVLKDDGEWLRVIMITGEGWVRAEDVETKPPFQLHVLWSEGKPIDYVNSVSGEL